MSRGKARLTNRLTIILDSICIAISFYMAAIIRGGILTSVGGYNDKYANALILLILTNIIISAGHDKNKHVFKRGYFEEFVCVIKDHLKLAMVLMVYMFVMKTGTGYSRIFFFFFYLLNVLLTYVVRSYLKIIMLLYYKRSSANNKVMLITLSQNARDILRHVPSFMLIPRIGALKHMLHIQRLKKLEKVVPLVELLHYWQDRF